MKNIKLLITFSLFSLSMNDLNNFYLVSPDGTDLSKPFISFNSSWTPNANQILFSNSSTPNGKDDIYLMDIKSYKIKKLVSNGSYPIWRPLHPPMSP